MRWHAKFLLSALSPEQFPDPGPPEIAFLGRSNVGKSSLINALLRTAAAKVSSTPGRTRAINFFSLHSRPERSPELMFADLPGYGYAKISKSISSEWPAFIEPYLEFRETLALCCCLIDMNIPPQQSDLALQEALRRWQRPVLLVATKADRLSGNKRTQQLKLLTEAFGQPILPCSAETGRGLNEIWAQVDRLAQA